MNKIVKIEETNIDTVILWKQLSEYDGPETDTIELPRKAKYNDQTHYSPTHLFIFRTKKNSYFTPAAFAAHI